MGSETCRWIIIIINRKKNDDKEEQKKMCLKNRNTKCVSGLYLKLEERGEWNISCIISANLLCDVVSWYF